MPVATVLDSDSRLVENFVINLRGHEILAASGFLSDRTAAATALELQGAVSLRFDHLIVRPSQVGRILRGKRQGLAFYFPRNDLTQPTVPPEEIVFRANIRDLEITAQFDPSAMLYQGHLAL